MKGKLIDVVKIVFSDFDNTMLHYYSNKNYFDDYQLEILQKLREEGIRFGIVTGRCVSFFTRFPKLLEVIDFILASNGACIYDVREKKFIYEKLVDNHSLNNIIGYAKSNCSKFIINSLDKRYQYGEWSDIQCETYQEGISYICEQVVLMVDKLKLEDCHHYLASLGNVVVNNVVCWDNYYSIDINDIGVSKGNSIVKLCQILEIDLVDTIGFGDGENDLSMFQVVGKSVAVGNANNKIRQISDDVSLKCNDNGVFRYLEDNILNR